MSDCCELLAELKVNFEVIKNTVGESKYTKIHERKNKRKQDFIQDCLRGKFESC